MDAVYSELHLPRARTPLLAGAALLVAALHMAMPGMPLALTLAMGAAILSGCAFALRPGARPTGTRITLSDWSFFVGERRWRLPLDEIASVAPIEGEDGVTRIAITFYSGHIDVLPAELRLDIGRLLGELEALGVRVLR